MKLYLVPLFLRKILVYRRGRSSAENTTTTQGFSSLSVRSLRIS